MSAKDNSAKNGVAEPRLIDDPKDDNESRDPFERDADRVLYSSNFRRLSGVTQVMSPGDDLIHHDRMTHSLKVAQVARRLAERIGDGLNGEVVHTAALIHDIGHPPFGHAVEDELKGLLDGEIDEDGHAHLPGVIDPILEDSFEGNAQSFRIVSRISARKFSERRAGLNLTFRTLAAMQKYPWTRGNGEGHFEELSHTKWGAYDSEGTRLASVMDAVAEAGLMGHTRSFEADVMDWADDVSYAVHDTEDFYRAGLIPLHELRNRKSLWKHFLEYARHEIDTRKVILWHFTEQEWKDAAAEIRLVMPHSPYEGGRSSREALHLFGSSMIDSMTLGISIDREAAEVHVPTSSRLSAEILKKLVRYYVIERPDLRFTQTGQRKIVRELFLGLRHMAISARAGDVDDMAALPPRFNDYCDIAILHSNYGNEDGSVERRLTRATIDFICSLTDHQAETMAAQLAGRTMRTRSGSASI